MKKVEIDDTSEVWNVMLHFKCVKSRQTATHHFAILDVLVIRTLRTAHETGTRTLHTSRTVQVLVTLSLSEQVVSTIKFEENGDLAIPTSNSSSTCAFSMNIKAIKHPRSISMLCNLSYSTLWA